MDLSLYIHIPFCVSKCRYCDFYSVLHDKKTCNKLLRAIHSEWLLLCESGIIENPIIKTIYHGGGTPSILSYAQWEQHLDLFISTLDIDESAEWTVECNPESFSANKVRLWQQAGVTRLSLGVQSLDERLLQLLGRPHGADAARDIMHNPLLDQFQSVGADIIFGIPGQSLTTLSSTVHEIVSQKNIHHISAYELTIHEGTCFHRHRKLLGQPSEDILIHMAGTVCQMCSEHGFEQYEVSNFSRPGHRSRHNSAYWDHKPYIGLGPGAHSYIHPNRWANVSDINQYIDSIENNSRPVQFEEQLSTEQLAHEMIMLRLRTTDGLDENILEKSTGMKLYTGNRVQLLDSFRHQNLIRYQQPFWRCTTEGMLVVDALTRDIVSCE